MPWTLDFARAFPYNSPMSIETSTSSRSYRWVLAVVALVILAADQWSKAKIIQWLALGESWRPFAGTPLLELFALTHTKNSGAAFGIFQTGGWFFVIVAIVVSLGILWYYPRLPREKWWLFLSLGLQLGGALGNLTDRLRIGHVTDFVHIGSFAIFNVADSAIVVGVLLLALHMYREEDAAKHEVPPQVSVETLGPDGTHETLRTHETHSDPNGHPSPAPVEETAIAFRAENPKSEVQNPKSEVGP